MIVIIVVIHALSFWEMEKADTLLGASGFSGFLVIREED
jgi:hypothetical protein